MRDPPPRCLAVPLLLPHRWPCRVLYLPPQGVWQEPNGRIDCPSPVVTGAICSERPVSRKLQCRMSLLSVELATAGMPHAAAGRTAVAGGLLAGEELGCFESAAVPFSSPRA